MNISGFSFEIALSDPDITLTDATTATTVATYIIAGNSLFGPDILVGTDGQDLIAADIYATPMGSSTVMAGATVGIGHVLFDVSSSAVPFPDSFAAATPGSAPTAAPRKN